MTEDRIVHRMSPAPILKIKSRENDKRTMQAIKEIKEDMEANKDFYFNSYMEQ